MSIHPSIHHRYLSCIGPSCLSFSIHNEETFDEGRILLTNNMHIHETRLHGTEHPQTRSQLSPLIDTPLLSTPLLGPLPPTGVFPGGWRAGEALALALVLAFSLAFSFLACSLRSFSCFLSAAFAALCCSCSFSLSLLSLSASWALASFALFASRRRDSSAAPSIFHFPSSNALVILRE